MRFAVEKQFKQLETRTLTDPFVGLKWTIAHSETPGWRDWRRDNVTGGDLAKAGNAAAVASILSQGAGGGVRARKRTEGLAEKILTETIRDMDVIGSRVKPEQEREAIAEHLVRNVEPLEVVDDDGKRRTERYSKEHGVGLLSLNYLVPPAAVREAFPFEPSEDSEDEELERLQHKLFVDSIKTVGRALAVWVVRTADKTQEYIDATVEAVEGESVAPRGST